MKKREPNSEQLSLPEGKRQRFSPDAVAKAAIARRPTTPSGAIKYMLTVFLRRDLAEAVTARALRDDKNVPLLVAEILEAELRQKRG